MVLEMLNVNETCICDVTFLEIMAGCGTVQKRENAVNALRAYKLLNNNEKISEISMQLMKRYCVQQTGQSILRLGDCLIASFALYHKMELLTFNKKDFDFIKGLYVHKMSK